MRTKILRYLRFFIFVVVVFIETVTACLLSTIISLLTFWRDPPLTLNILFINCFNFSCRVFLGIRFRVKGLENLPKSGHVFFASKHQSLWETIALIPTLSINAYVGKKWLSFIPIWGWALYSSGSYIPINRNAAVASTFSLLRNLRLRFASGKIVRLIIFPEGRRNLPSAPPNYRRGLELLYQNFPVTVVPLALNSGYVWPKRGYIRGGTITVSILPAIAPGLPRGKLMPLVEESIEREVKIIGIP